MDTKQAFWDEQAAKGELSGTRDRYAKELEMAAIARHVKDGMRVLDVGCGDGETLCWLSGQYNIWALGIDYSSEMIDKARVRPMGAETHFLTVDIKQLKEWGHSWPEGFDLIYTQRVLINLDSWEEQRQAILDILGLLRPGGTYVMVECFQEGLQEINELRLKVGLESIVPPWHNRYLQIKELMPLFKSLILDDICYWPDIQYFSGAYYLMSRVVNAWQSQAFGEENPDYTHPLNRLGTLLPPECVNLRGQVQCWSIKKKEK